MLGLILVLALGAPTNSETDGSLAEENELLKLRLQALEDELQEEKRHSYVVVHGYIAEAENVMMETMDIDQAKAWCNSHKRCKGFTFGGADERPGDEVTVTFKVGSPSVTINLPFLLSLLDASHPDSKRAINRRRVPRCTKMRIG